MQHKIKTIFSAVIGSLLEFYDFILYGLFAGVIATLFFPSYSHQASLMATFAVLAVGYFTRPLGGLLFGHLGDKFSRRRALIASLLCMGIITALIGCLPTYQSSGLFASIALLILRMCQGLTAGGEMAGSMVFLLECAPKKHQALVSMLSLAGAVVGVLLAIITASFITSSFSHAAILAGAWRLPFFFGLVLALLGCYLRLKLWQDSVELPVKLPFATLFKTHARAVILSLMFLSMPAIFTGITTVYLVPYLIVYFHFTLKVAIHMTFYVALTMLVFILIGACCADRVRRHRVWLFVGCLILAIVSYPLFVLMQASQSACVWGLILFAGLVSFVLGPEVVFFAYLFKKEVRVSGVGLTHGLTFSILTGTSPLILNALAARFGTASISFYFILTCVLSAVAVSLASD